MTVSISGQTRLPETQISSPVFAITVNCFLGQRLSSPRSNFGVPVPPDSNSKAFLRVCSKFYSNKCVCLVKIRSSLSCEGLSKAFVKTIIVLCQIRSLFDLRVPFAYSRLPSFFVSKENLRLLSSHTLPALLDSLARLFQRKKR